MNANVGVKMFNVRFSDLLKKISIKTSFVQREVKMCYG